MNLNRSTVKRNNMSRKGTITGKIVDDKDGYIITELKGENENETHFVGWWKEHKKLNTKTVGYRVESIEECRWILHQMNGERVMGIR